MSFRALVFTCLLVTLCVTIQSGLCIKCYTCSSLHDKDCALVPKEENLLECLAVTPPKHTTTEGSTEPTTEAGESTATEATTEATTEQESSTTQSMSTETSSMTEIESTTKKVRPSTKAPKTTTTNEETTVTEPTTKKPTTKVKSTTEENSLETEATQDKNTKHKHNYKHSTSTESTEEMEETTKPHHKKHSTTLEDRDPHAFRRIESESQDYEYEAEEENAKNQEADRHNNPAYQRLNFLNAEQIEENSICFKRIFKVDDQEVTERGCGKPNVCDGQEKCFVCDGDKCNSSSTISISLMTSVLSFMFIAFIMK